MIEISIKVTQKEMMNNMCSPRDDVHDPKQIQVSIPETTTWLCDHHYFALDGNRTAALVENSHEYTEAFVLILWMTVHSTNFIIFQYTVQLLSLSMTNSIWFWELI